MSESNYTDDYEDVTQYSLDEDREVELREKQRECTFMWTNKQGEPVGVIMSYLETSGLHNRKRHISTWTNRFGGSQFR